MMRAASVLLLASLPHFAQSQAVGSGVPAFGTLECMLPSRREVATSALEVLVNNTGQWGYSWMESPLLRAAEDGSGSDYLVFSDVWQDRLFKWEAGKGASVIMEHAGCYSDPALCQLLTSKFVPLGANGLATEPSTGLLLMAEQGERQITRLYPNGTKLVLVSRFQGKRLNSPNDMVFAQNGDMYFTDPAYGFVDHERDARRELDIAGVYRVPAASMQGLTLEGTGSTDVQLVYGGLQRPNGLALSPDGRTLYVGDTGINGNASWYAFDLRSDGSADGPRVLAKPSSQDPSSPDKMVGSDFGANDGMKVDPTSGRLYASVPGGVALLSPEGRQLGFLYTAGRFVTNVHVGRDGFLYVAGPAYIGRAPLELLRSCQA